MFWIVQVSETHFGKWIVEDAIAPDGSAGATSSAGFCTGCATADRYRLNGKDATKLLIDIIIFVLSAVLAESYGSFL